MVDESGRECWKNWKMVSFFCIEGLNFPIRWSEQYPRGCWGWGVGRRVVVGRQGPRDQYVCWGMWTVWWLGVASSPGCWLANGYPNATPTPTHAVLTPCNHHLRPSFGWVEKRMASKYTSIPILHRHFNRHPPLLTLLLNLAESSKIENRLSLLLDFTARKSLNVLYVMSHSTFQEEKKTTSKCI